MSPSEIAWRGRSFVRDVIDIPRAVFDFYPSAASLNIPPSIVDLKPGFTVANVDAASWSLETADEQQTQWLTQLIKQAESISNNRLSFFCLTEQFLGDPIDWHKDHESGKRQKPIPCTFINYRNYEKVGDCKLVWEPNRHHQFAVLARAYRVTGNIRYAQAVADQIRSWLDDNPVGHGMNWRSPLELGIRLINWVWALDLIRGSGVIDEELWARIYRAAYIKCWDISRKYSQGSSSNNHLIGEAAGVFVAASYFQGFPNSEKLRQQAKAILETEIISQSFEDGCNREHALGYQFFVMQFLTICALVAKETNNPMSENYMARLREQYRFVGFLSDGGTELPMFGDKDDGYVLDLGNIATDCDAVLSIGACLFGDEQLRERIRENTQSASWLFDKTTIQNYQKNKNESRPIPITSKLFADSGYALLQAGYRDTKSSMSLLFDCANLGYGELAAHGHADALSIWLRVNNLPFFVDAGTYDYFAHPEWRNYFRKTCAHNTVEIDGLSQAEPSGPFMWKNKTSTLLDYYKEAANNPDVSASHTGYAEGNNSVQIRRSISLSPDTSLIIIHDEVTVNGRCDVSINFHLDPAIDVQNLAENDLLLTHHDTSITLKLDGKLAVGVNAAQDDGFQGWVSNNYHVRTPSHTIRGTATGCSSAIFTHHISIASTCEHSTG